MDLKSKLERRRLRIVVLLGCFPFVGFLMISGLLDSWLGWGGGMFVWMAASTGMMIFLVWEFLGFFIDRASARDAKNAE